MTSTPGPGFTVVEEPRDDSLGPILLIGGGAFLLIVVVGVLLYTYVKPPSAPKRSPSSAPKRSPSSVPRSTPSPKKGEEKPFYLKWWFWLLVVLVLAGITTALILFLGGGESTPAPSVGIIGSLPPSLGGISLVPNSSEFNFYGGYPCEFSGASDLAYIIEPTSPYHDQGFCDTNSGALWNSDNSFCAGASATPTICLQLCISSIACKSVGIVDQGPETETLCYFYNTSDKGTANAGYDCYVEKAI